MEIINNKIIDIKKGMFSGMKIDLSTWDFKNKFSHTCVPFENIIVRCNIFRELEPGPDSNEVKNKKNFPRFQATFLIEYKKKPISRCSKTNMNLGKLCIDVANYIQHIDRCPGCQTPKHYIEDTILCVSCNRIESGKIISFPKIENCPICYEPMTVDPISLDCLHVFHAHCLKNCIVSECPLCRKKFDPVEVD